MAEYQTDPLTFEVGEADAGSRLDVFLAKFLNTTSRSQAQKMISAGRVTVNGKEPRSSAELRVGDAVLISGEISRIDPLQPIAMELDIVFEDEFIIVVNKPAGLTVHPGAGDTGPTLVEGLLFHCGTLANPLEGEDEDQALLASNAMALRPGIVHRLDKDTSGLLVCAKTAAAHQGLALQFQNKTNQREYLALLDGCMLTAEIRRESYLHRDPRSRLRFASMEVEEYKALENPRLGLRLARSIFSRTQTFASRITLARVSLYTGRTHQIRVHAKDLGLPVVGDLVYHGPTALPKVFDSAIIEVFATVKRQMLHANTLGFDHPVTRQKQLFQVDPPADFNRLVECLAPYSDPM